MIDRTRAAQAFKTAAVLVTLAGAVTAAQAAGNTQSVALRSGSHSEFGRIVVDTNSKTEYQVDQDGDHVTIRLTGDVSLGSPPPLPRNVLSMKTDGTKLELVLSHGAKVHPGRTNGRLILDILDKPTETPDTPPEEVAAGKHHADKKAARKNRQDEAAAAKHRPDEAPPAKNRAEDADIAKSRPGDAGIKPKADKVAAAAKHPDEAASASSIQPSLPMAVSPEPVGRAAASAGAPEAVWTAGQLPVVARPLSETTAPSPGAVQPPPATEPASGSIVLENIQQTPPGRDVMPENEGPMGLRARRTRLPKGLDGTAFLVPFEATTAAAAFTTADGTYVVFDERRPVDMAALASDPVFSHASVKLLPNGTVFHVPHPVTSSIVLTPMPQGWRIAAVTGTPKLQPIAAAFTDGRLGLAAEQPGDVVNLADPATGATLLVGTQHRPGQGVTSPRLSTEFILHPTSQGVVVEPLSDAIVLKQVPTGFSVSGPPSGLALSPVTGTTPALMEAAHLTRRLNLSTMPTDALVRLAVKQIGDAARAPPLARGPRHHAAAESMMALGLAAESESLLHMAAEQDPKEAASLDTTAMAAIAALLAGRPDEAGALMDPRLDGTDEIALWRAVLQAMRDEGSPSAAVTFAATSPLVVQYPAPIRDHILPLVVETMIQGGELPTAGRLLDQRKGDPKLSYARALMRQAEGDTAQALTMFDSISSGHDQFDRARAADHAVEMRLAAGQLDKTQAADALDKLLYSWRGDGRELALRQRVAELREQAGAWRVALATLRQAETDFPEQALPIHEQLKGIFARMIRDKGTQQIPPLEFVATVDENTDLLPDAGDDEAVEQPLADRLLALDLPARAKPVLDKLMHQAKSGVAKARFGTSLATLAAREGDDTSVLAMLDGTQVPDLPSDMIEQRLLLRAASVARRGDPANGAAMLAAAPTAATIQARAQILETASDWAGAEKALAEYAALTVPEAGVLDDGQARTVLRLATATARATDEAALAELRTKFNDRFTAGPLADMFRLLTAEPIKTSDDIKRSQQEMSLAASLPTDLKALQGKAAAR